MRKNFVIDMEWGKEVKDVKKEFVEDLVRGKAGKKRFC